MTELKVINEQEVCGKTFRIYGTVDEPLFLAKDIANLIENSMTNKILAMSDGLIGEISKIIELSAILAIESKVEKITSNILDSIDYTSPDKRKRFVI